jgi:type IV secretion system protein VirD4
MIDFKKLIFRNKTDQHGTAGFANIGEISKLTEQFKAGNIKVGEVKDFKILTRLVNLPKDLALKHTLIVGPTGAGKSRSFFLPNCFAAGNSSFVATDPKSELWDLTAYNQRKPIRFAPADPNNSATFNFVAYCRNIDFAERVAAAIVHAHGTPKSDPFWWQNEEALLTAALIHIANSDVPTPAHLYELLTAGTATLSEKLENSEQPEAQRLIQSYTEIKDEQKGAILTGLTGKLSWLNNKAVRTFTSSSLNAFDFGKLRERPIQIYWCLEQDDVERLQILTTIFFSVIITQLLKQKTGKVPVNLFFDEFANVGKIKSFEKHITLFRGQGIAINAGIQSVSQLDIYGKSEAETILDNFNNVLILAGLKNRTAEAFSKLLGDKTYIAESESISESGSFLNKKISKSIGQKEHKRALLTADELRRISDEEIILVSTNLRPVMMNKLFFKGKKKELLKEDLIKQIIPSPRYERIKIPTKFTFIPPEPPKFE